MIKQQLEAWKQFYLFQIEQTQNYINDLVKQKLEIEIDILIPNIDSFLLSLSVIFILFWLK